MGSENLNNSIAKNEISIKELAVTINDYYEYLLSKWILIFCMGLLGGIIGLTYAILKKPIYTATTTFVLEEAGSGVAMGQYAGLASMVGIDLAGGGGGLFQGDNILELYKSRTMIQKALLGSFIFEGKKHLLIDRFIEISGLKKDWEKNPELAHIDFNDSVNFSLKQDSIIGVIVRNINDEILNVNKLDKKSSIIKVEVKSKDEIFAKAFTNLIVSNVNAFYVQTKTKKSLDNVVILQRQTDSVKAVMNGAIYDAVQTMDATPNLNPTRQALRTPVQRSQFNADINKAILSELVKNLELSKISLRKEMPLIQVIDQPIFPLPKDKVSKIRAVVVGAFLGGLLIVFVLLFRKSLKNILT